MVTQPLRPTLELAPASSMHYFVRVLPILLGRNARLWLRFRVSMLMDLLTSAAQASIFFFIGSILAVSGHQAWQANYATFLAVGIVFNAVLEASLRGPYQSLSMDYWTGRLETILLSPCPVWLALLGDVSWSYVRALQNAVVFAALGWVFGARVQGSPVNILLTLVALGLACLAVLGFGFMSAAMFMLINAKGWNDPIAWLIGVLQGLITGVYFPISVLPGWLHTLALFLPQGYAIDAARRLLLPTADTPALIHIGTLSSVETDLTLLAVFAAILPVLGAILFIAGLVKTKTDGSLSRWT